MQADRELLGQYVKDGSEAAFAELVRRYVRLVYSVALRQAGREAHLAEDITQTVFIILARKAQRLAGHETLIGWLHATTRHTALCALRTHRRRQAREQEALAMETNSPTPVPWEQLRPLLDEAVGQLNERDRQAMLLRYFQGWSHREVGEALGLKEDAARVRVDRAVEKLRRYFAGRGIVTTGALLGEVILANAAETEPASFAGRVRQAAAAAPPAATGGLGAGLLGILLMTTKQKILAALLLVLAACLFTVAWPRLSHSQENGKFTVNNGVSQAATVPKSEKTTVEAPVTAPANPVNKTMSVSAPSSIGAVQTPSLMAPPPPSPNGAIFGPGGPGLRGQYQNRYQNLFLKLKLSAEQQKAFLDALTVAQKTRADLDDAASKKYTNEQMDALLNQQLNAHRNEELQRMQANPGVETWDEFQADPEKGIEKALGITDQVKPVLDAEDAQLLQILGSEDNYQAYLLYNNQQGVRNWVNQALGGALQQAGLPALTSDQQESLVGIIAESIQPGDYLLHLGHLDEVLDKAGAVLSPEQLEVLQTNPNGPGLHYAQLHYKP